MEKTEVRFPLRTSIFISATGFKVAQGFTQPRIRWLQTTLLGGKAVEGWSYRDNTGICFTTAIRVKQANGHFPTRHSCKPFLGRTLAGSVCCSEMLAVISLISPPPPRSASPSVTRKLLCFAVRSVKITTVLVFLFKLHGNDVKRGILVIASGRRDKEIPVWWY
jgi:hypothetical protein